MTITEIKAELRARSINMGVLASAIGLDYMTVFQAVTKPARQVPTRSDSKFRTAQDAVCHLLGREYDEVFDDEWRASVNTPDGVLLLFDYKTRGKRVAEIRRMLGISRAGADE